VLFIEIEFEADALEKYTLIREYDSGMDFEMSGTSVDNFYLPFISFDASSDKFGVGRGDSLWQGG